MDENIFKKFEDGMKKAGILEDFRVTLTLMAHEPFSSKEIVDGIENVIENGHPDALQACVYQMFAAVKDKQGLRRTPLSQQSEGRFETEALREFILDMTKPLDEDGFVHGTPELTKSILLAENDETANRLKALFASNHVNQNRKHVTKTDIKNYLTNFEGFSAAYDRLAASPDVQTPGMQDLVNLAYKSMSFGDMSEHTMDCILADGSLIDKTRPMDKTSASDPLVAIYNRQDKVASSAQVVVDKHLADYKGAIPEAKLTAIAFAVVDPLVTSSGVLMDSAGSVRTDRFGMIDEGLKSAEVAPVGVLKRLNLDKHELAGSLTRAMQLATKAALRGDIKDAPVAMRQGLEGTTFANAFATKAYEDLKANPKLAMETADKALRAGRHTAVQSVRKAGMDLYAHLKEIDGLKPVLAAPDGVKTLTQILVDARDITTDFSVRGQKLKALVGSDLNGVLAAGDLKDAGAMTLEFGSIEQMNAAIEKTGCETAQNFHYITHSMSADLNTIEMTRGELLKTVAEEAPGMMAPDAVSHFKPHLAEGLAQTAHMISNGVTPAAAVGSLKVSLQAAHEFIAGETPATDPFDEAIENKSVFQKARESVSRMMP